MKFAVTTLLILAYFASRKHWTNGPSYYDYTDYSKPVLTEYDANALKCYTCHSCTSFSGCGEDDFTPSKAIQTTCAIGKVCGKGVIGEVAFRGCTSIREGLANNECHASEKDSAELCYCSTDLCNNGLRNNLGLVLAFIAILGAKYL
ncbi:uncharacterized protein LOC117115659 [Anneissia japonica]|uniref:uncharacterized protein LOC117115659 n=1 Tax=Anneissia japonica TaxID=1529436 RepID=UPI001425698F|nr:uncharacterized protein LOC117115659 [Anneissia japonica]